ncbi:hypothetical protein GQ53DRAFT_852635 [Thozetella sp. PMI_491]|nr:hypothetical protein GQ53DRAFT_852635 [Thozetella sp. PMI_491]
MAAIKTLFSIVLLLLANIQFSHARPVALATVSSNLLEEWHTQFFHDLFISDDDELFQQTFDNDYSQDAALRGNSEAFTFDSFKAWLAEQRGALSNRTLLSSSYVTVPDDSIGLTGTVGHVSVVGGILDGASVKANIVSVLTTKLNDAGKQVNTAETFVMEVEVA